MKKGLLLLVIVLVTLFPIGVKTYVDKNIEKEISLYKQRGVELKILNEEGYFSSKRDFELIIKDTDKLADYISNISSSFRYIGILMKDGKSSLEGFVFKGSIENSNINYFADIKANVYLASVGEEDKKDKNHPYSVIVDKKLLNFDLLFTNKGQFKSSKLRNIDEKFIFEGESADLKVFGQSLENKSTKDRLKLETFLDKFILNIDGKNDKFETAFEDLKYNINIKNELLGEGDFSLKNLLIKDENDTFTFDNISASSKSELKDTKYNLENEIKLSKLDGKGKDTTQKLKVEAFKMNVDVLGLDYALVEKLKKDYEEGEKLLIEATQKKIPTKNFTKKYDEYSEQMLKNILLLLNKGFSLKIDSSLDDFIFEQSEIKSLDIDLDAKLIKNDLNTLINPFELLSFLDVDGKIVIDEKGFETISNLSRGMIRGFLSSYIKKDGQNIVFDIKFKDNNLNINNKEFTLR